MSFGTILLIAVALSFDAIAVAAANGAHHHRMSFGSALRIAIFFGVFQMLMPIIGWMLGDALQQVFTQFDHWVAFILLFGLGVKMVIESFDTNKEKSTDANSLKVLILLSIATSIDALVVGMTFAFVPVNKFLAVTTIGATTLLLSLLAVYLGKKCGERWGKRSEMLGGVILIAIGIKILVSHILG